MIYASDVAEAVAKGLQFVAPSMFGHRYLADNTKAPPRYVWVRASDSVGPAAMMDYNAPTIAQTESTLEVHCWGKTEREADRLRALLLNALIQSEFRQCIKLAGATWIEPEHMQLGSVCVQSIQVFLPVEQLCLSALVGGAPDSCVVEAPVQFVEFDGSHASDGNGVLEFEAS